MKVLKFGGTSMGSAENILKVKEIVNQAKYENPVVVVSAIGGITDLLLQAGNEAQQGNAYLNTLEIIKTKHFAVVAELFSGDEKTRVIGAISFLFKELAAILKGVSLTGELTVKSYDQIISFGERTSSLIFHHLQSGSKLYDSRQFIKTRYEEGRHIVKLDESYRLIGEIDKSFSGVSVFSGFIASNEMNQTTTLGRGGSDYTAALLAAGLKAQGLEIWTDVDGFMSADPRVINNAYTIDHLTYAEAMELSHFGAKVIYPPTIMPVLQAKIPIQIKNTFNSKAPGTLIDHHVLNGRKSRIKGISSIRHISLLTLQGAGMIGISGISMRLFKALADLYINVILISQASSENSITIAIESCVAKKAARAINGEFANEIQARQVNEVLIENNLAVIAIVGEKMKRTSGVAGRLFRCLGVEGINLYAIAQGASELNISFVIKESDIRKAINVIHETFFLSDFKVINLYLTGTGVVGKKLMDKLKAHAPNLRQNKKIVVRLVGIANSRKMYYSTDGIPFENAIEYLEVGQKSDMFQFKEAIVRNNLVNSVFVDCTASEKIADYYLSLLKENVSVVTANKIASSSSYKNYSELKNTAYDHGIKYLFETNVGAGLPIIGPINDLVNSGDRIIKLEAVLSGTLNYICNQVSADKSLSQVIMDAREKGYSEPDPRIDLSGKDVIRKILILARESGYEIEQGDIEYEPFVPQTVLDSPSYDDFIEKVRQYDETFEKRRLEVEQRGSKLRYVAALENGRAFIEFKEVDQSHPLFHLEDTNNMVLIWSDNYFDHPMSIKGYGAGADVTAAGVFADIIKTANV
ncbi:bifunctional aspartate kinase/homoserine dehydrogenase I [Marinilabiliaceae bacterium JC017]|nr:bifunctional aspartate kinase/homoserine dehydrogenase I [Marinilabiliaceae bacterium JC017]